MGQRYQQSLSGTEDAAWLNTLIGAFERTEELGNVPCDAKTVSAAMSRLSGQSVCALPAGQRRRMATLELHH